MTRVWRNVLRWSSQGLRLHATGVLCLTFLVLLTTNLYFVNRTVLDINMNQSKLNDHLIREDDIIDEERPTNVENILLKKLKTLKDELKRTRSRIDKQKRFFTENRTQYKQDIVQKPVENVLKRHLMNADKSQLSMPSSSTQKSEIQAINKFLNFQLNSSFLSCQDLPTNINRLENVGAGYTKQVKRVIIGENVVALKVANIKGHDAKECALYGMTEEDCMRLTSYKVLKELVLLQQLESLHIIKLLGYCVRDEKMNDESSSITIATEYGEPLTFITLLQMSWEDRLKIAFGITKLLDYLHNSPIGALIIHDFKLSQFVLVDNALKLADLDDVEDTKPICKKKQSCGIGNMSREPCINGLCQHHYSDRLNVYHAHKLIYTLLPFEAPVPVQRMIGELTNNTGQATWSSGRILNTLEEILDVYRNSSIYDNIGKIRHVEDIDEFDQFPNQDYPAMHDYWCHGTIYAGANSCAFSVVDENEARYLCTQDPQCKAFVMTSQKTWTGRTVVFLKNQAGNSVPSDGKTLFTRSS